MMHSTHKKNKKQAEIRYKIRLLNPNEYNTRPIFYLILDCPPAGYPGVRFP
jgi:hypothetical protein